MINPVRARVSRGPVNKIILYRTPVTVGPGSTVLRVSVVYDNEPPSSPPGAREYRRRRRRRRRDDKQENEHTVDRGRAGGIIIIKNARKRPSAGAGI